MIQLDYHSRFEYGFFRVYLIIRIISMLGEGFEGMIIQDRVAPVRALDDRVRHRESVPGGNWV